MKLATAILSTLLVSAALAGCIGTTEKDRGDTASTGQGERLDANLAGSGSTFVAPFMSALATGYNGIQPGVRVAYASTGSGQGIKQITDKTVDFGATDAPMKDSELSAAPGVLHVPIALGGVAVIYHLPGLSSPLKLDAATVADLFERRITTWNDPKIAAQNPGVSLPGEEIIVVVRSDGSGTTDTFTTYLDTATEAWTLGKGKTVSWAAGIQQAKGNEGVGATVKQTPYAVGYAGSEWAFVQQVQMAQLKNKAGKYVAPTLDGISQGAGEGIASLAADTRGTLVDPPGNGSYPIVALTWALVYKDQVDEAKGKAVVDFLWYVVHDGQSLADKDPLTYAPLPSTLVQKCEQILRSITHAGRPLRS